MSCRWIATARLMRFSMAVQDRFASLVQPADVRIVAPVALPPSTLQQINQAASAHHQTPAEWMTDTLAHAAQSQP